MSRYPGPGPVFAYEWLTGARRWQVYATRAAFVAALLIAIGAVWESQPAWGLAAANAQGALARKVYLAVVGTQLALVLLAAPAATAGAVCIDKARGTLAHVLVTDLTDAEIVLGKLAARLVPVLTFVGCSIPVMYLCTLLGGIDPNGLAVAYAVTLGAAVLGCSLALTLSVWARKTHEVLLATYLAWAVWLLAPSMSRAIGRMTSGSVDLSPWLEAVDPFQLAFAPYVRTASTTIGLQAVAFLAGCLVLSAGLLALAVARVRRVSARDAGRAEARRPRPRNSLAPARRRPGILAGIAGRLPGPRLDGNPVLWREWYRNRPTGWTRRIWGVYVAGAVGFTLLALLADYPQAVTWTRGRTALWVNGFQVAIGILLLSVGAATSLAEERARGSLDVLMTTPLSTAAIVRGKWLGTFRTVPRLALLPGLLAFALAAATGRWTRAAILVAEVVAYGAFITSLGLALATWIPRLGRAVAACVAIDVLLTVGLFFLIATFVRGPDDERWFALGSFGGPAVMTLEAAGEGPPRAFEEASGPLHPLFLLGYIKEFLAIGLYLAGAVVLYAATLATFDRCLGRASPRRARTARKPLAFSAANTGPA